MNRLGMALLVLAVALTACDGDGPARPTTDDAVEAGRDVVYLGPNPTVSVWTGPDSSELDAPPPPRRLARDEIAMGGVWSLLVPDAEVEPTLSAEEAWQKHLDTKRFTYPGYYPVRILLALASDESHKVGEPEVPPADLETTDERNAWYRAHPDRRLVKFVNYRLAWVFHFYGVPGRSSPEEAYLVVDAHTGEGGAVRTRGITMDPGYRREALARVGR